MVKGNKTVLLAVGLLAATTCAAIAADVAPTVQLHGYSQNRLYTGSGANVEPRVERLSLSATAALPQDSVAYTEIYYAPWAASMGIYLESAYYDTAVLEGRVRLGKGRRLTAGIVPAYGNRKTSNYGIVAEALTQDRIQGAQYVYQKGTLDTSVALQSAYRMGYRPIGDIAGDTERAPLHTVAHLAFRDANSGGGSPAATAAVPTAGSYNRKPAVSARVGGKFDKLGLKVGVSGYFGQLDDQDVKNLTGAAGATNDLRPNNPLTGTTAVDYILGSTVTSRVQQYWGPDFVYKNKSGWLVQGEWYKAKVSTLKYTAWEALAGWEPTNANAWRFYARYGVQNMDIVPNTNPLTWDTNQLTLSAVQPLHKGLWLQYEYEINAEKNGGLGKVKNNLGFVELFTAF